MLNTSLWSAESLTHLTDRRETWRAADNADVVKVRLKLARDMSRRRSEQLAPA
jgi:hypothetical protein